MWFFKQLINRVPKWAFLLVLLVVVVNTIYLVNMPFMVIDDSVYTIEDGNCVITSIKPGGGAEKAGLQTGDTVLSMNSFVITQIDPVGYLNQLTKCDTITYVIERNGIKVSIPVLQRSLLSERQIFFHVMYVIILLLSFASVYILYKKPNDLSVKIFFIYLQLCAMEQNVYYLFYAEVFANFATVFFMFSVSFFGLLLIHFHLLFPQQAFIYKKFKRILFTLYGIGSLVFVTNTLYYFILVYRPSPEIFSIFIIVNKFFLSWITLTFSGAFAVVIYQFVTIKSTLARNQLRILIIGSFFGFAPPMFAVAFYDIYWNQMTVVFPLIANYSQWIGSLIMISCFLIALFQFRIWETEILIRKALLYIFASFVIVFSYFLMIYLVDQYTSSENNFTHFFILLVSVIIFLILRDSIQRLINRFFHREAYDSATVVSDFEEKLAGIYRFEELKSAIVKGLDDIFHFKTLIFNIKKRELTYEPAYSLGQAQTLVEKEYKVTPEMESRLQKSKIFSPVELNQRLSVPEIGNGELVVPLLNENKAFGFFLCGPKKSELTYSLQDIRVLSLLAKRIVALFNTATLFQNDLDRQLVLERERARISQDMHDDVGASLTRISILSDLAKNKTDVAGDTKQWLGQISETSRGVMEEMNQIIWALNPKNDTLEGLVAYLRRFVYEDLEPTTVNCTFDLPENLPYKVLTVEVRRNVYLVVREAMHNVVKHAVASKVWISLKMNEHGFRIIITDDGKGFDPDSLKFPGNGLINMKKRMSDIEGEFQFKSKTGEGTVIELVVPLE